MLLNKRYGIQQHDWKQIAVMSYTICAFVPFSVFTSLKVLERDFKYQQYNTWEAGMTYVWRLIPQVYIPVDYY